MDALLSAIQITYILPMGEERHRLLESCAYKAQ